MIPNIVLIAFCTLWVVIAGAKSSVKGFCVATGLLVALPETLRIETGGSLPELTVHRILLLLLLAQSFASPMQKRGRAPLFGLLLLAFTARGVSLLLSVTPGPSFKNLLGYLLEVVVFYRIAYTIVKSDREAIIGTTRALVGGLAVVAAAITLDRYTSLNPLTAVFSGLPEDSYGAQGTYPHRILFGYAMAMGAPLAICLLDLPSRRSTKILLWAGLCLMVAACYFATSRGPWIGLGLAIAVVGILGGRLQRKRCLWIAIFAAVACLLRPGIWETIANKYGATFDTATQKGKSYEYRYRLWYVAGSEISKSPERLLFGYGGLSTESMDLSSYFEAQAGETKDKLGYTSWDSRYACDLIEFGTVGFALSIIIFVCIPLKLFRAWRDSEAVARSQLVGVVAAIAVFVFAQTNVDIFSVQLKFLFWTVAAVGFGSVRKNYEMARATPLTSHSSAVIEPATSSVGG